MPEHQRPLKVFLCHAHSDKNIVRDLYLRLIRDGVDAWLDKEKLLPGQDWEMEIRKAVREADVVVVCLSKQFNQAGFRQKEVRLALDTAMEQPEGEIFIIPARLEEECDNLESLRKWHRVDLFEDDGYARLTRALAARANKIGATLQTNRRWLPKLSTIPKSEKRLPETKQGTLAGSHKPVVQKTKPKPNTAIAVALIGFVGTIIAGLLSSPLIEKMFSPVMVPTGTVTAISTATISSETTASNLTLTETILPTPTFTETLSLSPTPSITPTSTTSLSVGSAIISEKDGMKLLYVPAGEFTMGRNSGKSDEKPAHQVFLDAFWIDETEVTITRYNQCVQSGVCEGVTHPNYDLTGSSDQPIIMVTWYDANKYCTWAQRRLPTEAEWEKAARGTDARIYPWGNGDPSSNLVNMKYPADYQLLNVGSYPDGASPYGALDMAGSVWEWVSDWYDNNYYSNSPSSNPTGPLNGTSKVMRGGGQSFAWQLDSHRSVGRAREAPLTTNIRLGFRCTMDASP